MAGGVVGALNRAIVSWALSRALRLAIGTGVVALLLATTLPGEASERFATTAYLAAIVAAMTLGAGRFFSTAEPAQPARASSWPLFPVFLGYSVAIVASLSVVAAFVSQPDAEVLALLAAVLLIVLAVMLRSGALSALNAALMRGGLLSAASRYAVLGAICAFAFAAIVGSPAGDGAVQLAYRLAVIATVAVAVSMLVPTPLGIFVRRTALQLLARIDRSSRALVFERTATNAAIAAAATIAVASLLPAPFTEPFAVAAYIAAATAAFGVAMECRRLRL